MSTHAEAQEGIRYHHSIEVKVGKGWKKLTYETY